MLKSPVHDVVPQQIKQILRGDTPVLSTSTVVSRAEFADRADFHRQKLTLVAEHRQSTNVLGRIVDHEVTYLDELMHRRYAQKKCTAVASVRQTAFNRWWLTH